MEENKGTVTFKGKPITLVGHIIKTGEKFPDAEVTDNDLNPVKLSKYNGKVRIITSVPSLDTPVCDMETRKFNEAVKKMDSDNVIVLTISMDTPFAQKRWCGANHVSNVITLSDYKDANLGKATGTLIKELRLLARAVFVVDEDNIVRYVEYVKDITNHPNYEAALQSVEKVAK